MTILKNWHLINSIAKSKLNLENLSYKVGETDIASILQFVDYPTTPLNYSPYYVCVLIVKDYISINVPLTPTAIMTVTVCITEAYIMYYARNSCETEKNIPPTPPTCT